MAYSVEQQLENVKYNLRNTISQLKLSSNNLKAAKGISMGACTQRLDTIVREYEGVLRQLENIRLENKEDADAFGSNGGGGIR